MSRTRITATNHQQDNAWAHRPVTILDIEVYRIETRDILPADTTLKASINSPSKNDFRLLSQSHTFIHAIAPQFQSRPHYLAVHARIQLRSPAGSLSRSGSVTITTTSTSYHDCRLTQGSSRATHLSRLVRERSTFSKNVRYT